MIAADDALDDVALPGDPPPLGTLAERAERGDAESLVAEFAASLTAGQAALVCRSYDYVDERLGLVRAFVGNHWQATVPPVRDDFYSGAQQALVHAIFRALLSAEARAGRLRQLEDDGLGARWGRHQSVALLGDPAEGRCQFVYSGRHVTLRADGGADPKVAFGGPVFYAHAPGSYVERPDHPGNVWWHEALAASRWLDALPAALAARAIVDALPPEPALGFRTTIPGLPLADVDAAQLAAAERWLDGLLAHFRARDGLRVRRCLDAQGGLRACFVQFARDGRMSAPRFDNWRLEGPAFIWHWRGFPHVHAWVHAATTPEVPVNAASGLRLYRGHDPLPQRLFPFPL